MTLYEAVTPGMQKALSQLPSKRQHACGFPIPVYVGRYPKNCPVCGEPLKEPEVKSPEIPAPERT
jgi:hypothetical protein